MTIEGENKTGFSAACLPHNYRAPSNWCRLDANAWVT
jgi:hypothetical protein